MAANIPFQPLGKTYVAIANAASGTITVAADAPCNQIRIYNANASVVYVALSSAVGNAAASIPTAASPAYGLPIAGQSDITLTGFPSGGQSNITIAIISSQSANLLSTVYITPGEGFRG